MSFFVLGLDAQQFHSLLTELQAATWFTVASCFSSFSGAFKGKKKQLFPLFFFFFLTTTVKHLNQTADTWQDELQFKVPRPGPSGRMEERWSASTLTNIKSVTSCLPIGCHRGSFEFDFACSAWHQLINVAGTWFLWPLRLLTEHFWVLTLPEAWRPRLLEGTLRTCGDGTGLREITHSPSAGHFGGATSTDPVCFFTSEGLSLWEIFYRGGFVFFWHGTLSIFDNVYF